MAGEVNDEAGAPIRTIKTPSALVDLLASTVITANGTVNHDAVTALDKYVIAAILLTIAAKTMDASTTLDIYLQYSPDQGVTWDDLAHFAQVTSAAIGNGTYILLLNKVSAYSAVDRVTAIATIAANSIRDVSWCDRIRVSTVAANFAGSDTITVKVQAFME